MRMRALSVFCAAAIVAALSLPSFAAEKAGKRYVIIHADDAGMSHNANLATIEAMEKGIVSSTSIMVPCPWFPEFAAYAKAHPDGDYGIHLTLNSEWKHYKWGPVAKRSQVPSLLDKQGFLWSDTPDVAVNARAEEVEVELRAQIDRALEFGVPLSHLDSHMGSLVVRPDLMEVYAKLAIDYDLPILVARTANKEVAKKYPDLFRYIGRFVTRLEDANIPVIDAVVTTSSNSDNFETRKRDYLKVLRETKPGITEIIIHCGIANDELHGITGTWLKRDGDRRVFIDPAVRAAVKDMGIEVITWKQVREMQNKKAQKLR